MHSHQASGERGGASRAHLSAAPAHGLIGEGQLTEHNKLLKALPSEEYGWLRPHFEPVELTLKMVLAEPGEPFRHVYFIESGVVSVVNTVGEGTVEVGTIGNEGMAGLSVFLDADAATSKTFVQVPGHAKRINAEIFATQADERRGLRQILHRYTHAFLTQVAQTASCNRMHEVQERCARWLLMTHDRVEGSDSFPLTHEFLSFMLGVRRAGVTVAAGALQKAGLIRYTRGKITVLDRQGLEEASCECYGIVRAHFQRLIG